MKFFSKDQQVVVFILGLMIFFMGLFRPFHPFWSMLRPSHGDTTTKPHRQWIIEVAGAVKNPGIYTFNERPTLYKAIQNARGVLDDRRLSCQTDNALDTGMRIALQGSNTEYAQLNISPISTRKRLVLGIPIRLNQARVEDLAMIPGISYGLARRIVEYRESHGPFKKWNDLRRVKGVGPKNIESFRSYLSLTRTGRNQK
ncbi:MAG: helix-hairpin-helix domain-containing protein [Deltaproteobacteria bacterium]|nr:helix-hairpin-helix domain-containing protein [Deltaproteobacteria bacterium]MBW2019160.1 helix-hairpin-helix domain-containing protein [Deltaproteobacteria bacterium]MBW2073963.1 helix-hairpin-helix domain-containing protein [Deltaproteobacteria bacterium]